MCGGAAKGGSMKKVLAKSAAAVLALLLAAGMCFFAACDSGTPPSEGYTAFYNAVQRKGGIDYEDLDDDNYGALDITVTAGKSSIAFAFSYSTKNAFHMAFIDFYRDFSKMPTCSYYENYYSSGLNLRADMHFDVFTYTTSDFEANQTVNGVETELVPTDNLYSALKSVSERALYNLCVWVDAVVAVETDERYGIEDICPAL